MKHKVIAVLLLLPILYLTFHDFLELSLDGKILNMYALFLCGLGPFFIWHHKKLHPK